MPCPNWTLVLATFRFQSGKRYLSNTTGGFSWCVLMAWNCVMFVSDPVNNVWMGGVTFLWPSWTLSRWNGFEADRIHWKLIQAWIPKILFNYFLDQFELVSVCNEICFVLILVSSVFYFFSRWCMFAFLQPSMLAKLFNWHGYVFCRGETKSQFWAMACMCRTSSFPTPCWQPCGVLSTRPYWAGVLRWIIFL